VLAAIPAPTKRARVRRIGAKLTDSAMGAKWYVETPHPHVAFENTNHTFRTVY